jgi:PAS domain S-box-containing protein
MKTSPYTLLIVEDFPADRELYYRALRAETSCDYRFLEAESVSQGLSLCSSSDIDAVLLDYSLPDADGLEFLAKLPVQSNGSRPPVVMMTGQGSEHIAVQAMKLGIQDYLIKRDLTPEILRSAVRNAIENHRLKQQLQQYQECSQLANQRVIEIWESMTDAYVTVDRDWRIIYANQAATQVICHLTNLAPTEFLGRSHWELFPSLVDTDVEREFRRALTERVAVHLEVWFEPTGSWFESHLYPAAEGLGIYFRDISDRKQLEAERLAATQERDRFFEISLDLLAIANLDNYFLRLNPAWEQTLGFSTAELMAKPFLDFVHPDDRAATLATAQGLSRGQTVVRFENRYLCKDGSYRWLSWSSRPYDEQNLVYAVAYDITTQKRDEELLRQSEELKRRILESSRDCVKVVDLQGRLIYMNDYGQSLMEIDDFDTVAGSQWLEFWQDSTRASAQTAFSTALTGGVDRFDGYCATNKGTPKWWEVIVTPILAADGQVSQILSVSRDITDRKRMEAVRISAEQERDRFFSQSLDLLAIGNFDGYFVRINPAFERLLGFTETEFVSRPFIDFVHPDDREYTLAAAYSLADDRIVFDFENRCLCKDGSSVWVSWSATPYQQSNCWYGVGRDITERKQAEVALRESEQKFSAIFNQTFELMGIVSLDGVLLDVNQAALESIGAQRKDVTGKLFWETPWWHSSQLQQQLQDSIDRAGKGEFIRYEVQFPHVSGETLTTDFSLKPVFDDAGKVWTIVAEAHDITERKRAERDLRESQERLQTGIEVAGVGLARFDYATNLVALSPEAAVLYGFPTDIAFVTREQIHETFHPDERAELEATIAQVIDPAGTGWFAQDHRVVWPNGEVRCLSVRKQVFFDRVGDLGCPSHAILAAIDITARNQTQADLEARNHELDSFVHIVSHDLKAPLRAVSNLSQWIEEDLEGTLTEANQEQMNLLRARIERMSATIDGLLDYARIGRTTDSIEPVAVGEVIAETLEMISPPPTFQIAISKNLPTLYTKRLLLTQVFANLIGNGIKHHDRVDGAIHIGIAERSDVYEFAIADDGPGIEPEQHDRVFRIFQAVNPQNRSDSTGIGLAIVKKIVEAEGGTIRLESQLGKGTTFYFTWPKRIERG